MAAHRWTRRRSSGVSAAPLFNGATPPRFLEAEPEGIGSRLPNQTLPAEPLDLDDEEKQALIAFLHALTDTSYVASR